MRKAVILKQKSEQTDQQDVRKRAGILILLILLTAFLSLAVILLFSSQAFAPAEELTADIYQDGKLIASIRLKDVKESRTFTVTDADGGSNVVEVRPGEIGILRADCPDRLCVRQGFIRTSLLPIVCLPHRLVIRLRPEAAMTDAPDAVVR